MPRAKANPKRKSARSAPYNGQSRMSTNIRKARSNGFPIATPETFDQPNLLRLPNEILELILQYHFHDEDKLMNLTEPSAKYFQPHAKAPLLACKKLHLIGMRLLLARDLVWRVPIIQLARPSSRREAWTGPTTCRDLFRGQGMQPVAISPEQLLKPSKWFTSSIVVTFVPRLNALSDPDLAECKGGCIELDVSYLGSGQSDMEQGLRMRNALSRIKSSTFSNISIRRIYSNYFESSIFSPAQCMVLYAFLCASYTDDPPDTFLNMPVSLTMPEGFFQRAIMIVWNEARNRFKLPVVTLLPVMEARNMVFGPPPVSYY